MASNKKSKEAEKRNDAIYAIKNHIHSSRGLSIEETIVLASIPKIDISKTQLPMHTVISQAKGKIETVLGRKNIPGKDMRNAITSIIKWP